MEELFHANGQLAATGEVDSLGRKHGLWNFIYPSGAGQGHARFVAGCRHGEFLEFHASGKLKEQSHYRRGRRWGPARLCYRSGQVLFDGALLPVPSRVVAGLAPEDRGGDLAVGDGFCEFFFPNGVRSCLLRWSNGAIEDGRYTFRTETDEVEPVLTGRWRRCRRVTWLNKPVPGVRPLTHFDFDYFRRLDDPGRPFVAPRPMQFPTSVGQPGPEIVPTPAMELPSPGVEDGMRDYF